MTGRLDGKIALIVGGATGFGLATATRFRDEGAHVVIAGRRAGLAREVAAELGGTGVGLDITDYHDLEAVTAQLVDELGRIDVAVNYAGYEQSCSLRDLTPDVVEPMVEVQFSAAIYFIRAMGNAMAASGGGSIISISSLTAQSPALGHSVYAGAKAGIEYVTRVAAVEYGGDGVRANCVAPHLIETPMTSDIFDNELVIEGVRRQTPLGRMGHVDDIANCVLFLAGDESGYISGETIRVDGGAFTQKLPTAADYELLAKAHPELL